METSLTPRFCLNTTALRDFLRLSRAASDDSISAHLNGLLQPSSHSPFQPQSTSQQQQRRSASGSRQNVDGTLCQRFSRDSLFPEWRRRDAVLRYCHDVAASPDPLSEPSAVTTLTESDDTGAKKVTVKKGRNIWGAELDVDERLDPYSARDYSYARSSRQQDLQTVLENEENVERIVRMRTWAVMLERCRGPLPNNWQDSFNSSSLES